MMPNFIPYPLALGTVFGQIGRIGDEDSTFDSWNAMQTVVLGNARTGINIETSDFLDPNDGLHVIKHMTIAGKGIYGSFCARILQKINYLRL